MSFVVALCLFFSLQTETPIPDLKAALERSNNTAPTPASIAPEEAAEKTDLAKYRFSARWGHETDPVLTDFADWTQRYLATDIPDRPALIDEGIALAKVRRATVAKLIRNQPKLALAQTPPVLIRNQLPPPILELLEQRVTGQGDLLVLARTDPDGASPVNRRASINGAKFEAFTYGDRLAQRSARNVSLHGVALDGALALSDSPLRVFEEGEPIPANKPLASESCVISQRPAAPTKTGPRAASVAAESGAKIYWMCHGGHVRAASDGVSKDEAPLAQDLPGATGPHSLLVILVDFSDQPGAPAPDDSVRATADAVDLFYRNCSYQDFSIPTKVVTPVLRMPRTGHAYANDSDGDTSLLDDAREAALAAGFNPNNFDYDVVALGSIGFPWRGQGYVGLKGAWVQGPFIGDVLAHELGHNLGLWHANSWRSSTIIGETGNHQEYGNLFDVMSSVNSFPLDQISGNFKYLLGWLGETNLTTATNSGAYRLYAHDQSSRLPNRPYAIKIPVGLSIAGEVEDYWIDFRQLLTPNYPATADGAIIQWGNDVGTQNASRLLDMTPNTFDLSDAPLAIGETFRDADQGVEITTLAKAGSDAEAFLDLHINLTLPPPIPLADALDTSNLEWSSSARPWVGVRSVSHDGIDSAASAPTRDSAESSIETSITGPGGISFWWRVSSEQDFDFLHFYVDDVEFAAISGEVDWEFHSYELPAGQHILKWAYTKDQAASFGADRAWVDQVSLTVGPRAPQINVQPQPTSVAVSETAEFRVQAGGSDPLTYQWRHGATELPRATNSTLTITNTQLLDAGFYSVVISNPAGTISSSNALLTVWRLVPLDEALDYAATWTTFGDQPWRGQTDVTSDHIDAAQSGAVPHGKQSSLSAAITGPGHLSFSWKVSSEETFDYLALYLDGELIERRSGDRDWASKTLLIPNGSHILRWTYLKDQSLSQGADAAWVDLVQFAPVENLPASVTSAPAAQSVSVGGTAIFKVGFAGSNPVSFQWFRNDEPLNARPGLTGVNSAQLTLANVQTTDAGSYNVLVKNAFGEETSLPATLQIVTLSLGDAVDQPLRLWTTGGDTNWTGQVATTHDTIDAAMSGALGNSRSTWLQTEITGPANLAYWWKVSSETNFDTLTLEMDAVPLHKISGEVNWRQETVPIPTGLHRLRWNYAKDANTASGLDRAWLDQVTITGETAGVEIRNLSYDATGLTATIDGLQGARYILEISEDLDQWSPVATNTITTPSATFHRATTKNAEYLRVKIE